MEFTRFVFCFFFKQRTAYELRISDWSSDVCSSDLKLDIGRLARFGLGREVGDGALEPLRKPVTFSLERPRLPAGEKPADKTADGEGNESDNKRCRSEEHTSELQSLMRISYAVFCLKKKKKKTMRYSRNNT